ncbi:hypothetical protein BV20DRAFT_788569 [Pilatotrama ljubarskyi]|nr:hypothetical protein BV20DRAFT_788569 [Pilatotrama ljubarskyi]
MHPPHPAILTIDILDEIFSHLRCLEADDRENRRALFSAARVCTAFCEPAIKSLWWALPGLEPALKLLAIFSLVQRDAALQYLQKSSYFIGVIGQPGGADITSENWSRFLQYTIHTRIIHEGPLTHSTNPAVYVYLSHKNNGRPIFPHLQDLAWFSDTPDHLGLRLFTSPGLRKLQIIIGRGDRPMPAMQPGTIPSEAPPSASDTLLQTTLPHLTGLLELQYRTLSYMSPPREVQTWACIAQMRQLRVLRLDECCAITDPHHLRGLASLPNLVGLQIAVAMDRPASAGIRGFPALQKLGLSITGMIDPGPALLSTFTSPELHTLVLAYRRAFQDAIPDSLNIVANSFPRIRSLTVKVHSGVNVAAAIPRTFDAVFGQLTQQCTLMEKFVIDTHRGLIICQGGDTELEVLAASWPRLRVLSLLATISGPITHRSLVALARHCLELRTLHLRNVSFCGLTNCEAIQPSQHQLQVLGICGASYAASPRCSARFLRHLFPRLQVPEDCWTCPSCGRFQDHDTCARATNAILAIYGIRRRRPDNGGGPLASASAPQWLLG